MTGETRLLTNDPKVRATAEAALVKGAERSMPLLRRFLDNEDLHLVTFGIIQQIGRPAIPLLVDLLRHQSDWHCQLGQEPERVVP